MLSILNRLPTSFLRFLDAALTRMRIALDLRIAIWAVLYSRATREAGQRVADSAARRAELDKLARSVPEFTGWSCAVGDA